MRAGYKKIFNDEKKLQEMLDLRSQGWSFPKLGARYGCDHSSIIYQVKKHGVRVKSELLNQFQRSGYRKSCTIYPTVEISITESDKRMGVVKMNQGKDYIDYLRELNIQLRDIGGWKIEKSKKIVNKVKHINNK